MEPLPHVPSSETGSNPSAGRFRPYASTKHRVTRGRYITSNDRRGYIPVYEYPLNGQWIMMDIDDGYILWTGIWKALGNAKADIVKMLESQPDLAPQLRRVRGGYLKIQGTWMPYEVALRLARRVAWAIREDLIPLFGPTFPSTCLAPDQPGYGQILGAQQGKRRGRRAAVPLPSSTTAPAQTPESTVFDSRRDWDPHHGHYRSVPGPSTLPPLKAREPEHPSTSFTPASSSFRPSIHQDVPRTLTDPSGSTRQSQGIHPPIRSRSGYQSFPSSPLTMGPPPPPSAFGRLENTSGQRLSPLSFSTHDATTMNSPSRASGRYSPYHHAAHERRRSSGSFGRPSPIDLPPLSIPASQPSNRGGSSVGSHRLSPSNQQDTMPASRSPVSGFCPSGSTGGSVALPPILSLSPDLPEPSASRRHSDSFYSSGSGSGYSLPPIASLDEVPLPGTGSSTSDMDSRAVLKRLALDDAAVGRSRLSGFVVEGSHRDDEGLPFEPPTREQLWSRRRSLSEPPTVTSVLPKSQHEWPDARPGPDTRESRNQRGPSLTELEGTRMPSGLTVPRVSSPSNSHWSGHLRRTHSQLSDDDGPRASGSVKRARVYAQEPGLEQASAAPQSRISLLREGFDLGRSTESGAASGSPRDSNDGTPHQSVAPLPLEPWDRSPRARPSSPPGRYAYRRRSPEERSPHAHYHHSDIDLTGYRFGGSDSVENDQRSSFHSPEPESGHMRRGGDS